MNKQEKAVKLAEEVLDFVNTFGCDEQTFAETICRGHKTLQQSTMRLFMATIRQMSEVRPDARNQETVNLAKKIVQIADSSSLPMI